MSPKSYTEVIQLHAGAGSTVTAGTVNCDGSLSVLVQRSGEETAMADIVKAVESAQARAAPIQRVADAVAGRFAVGVMVASAATFAFWATLGPSLFPQVRQTESTPLVRNIRCWRLHRTVS